MDGETSTRHDIDLLEGIVLDENAEPTYLPLSLLKDITNCFSDECKIGSGGFAVVYKGIVGKGVVAVKKLSKTSDLPETKFHREIQCLMKAKHKNIVRFLGYCSEVQGRIADHEGKFVMSDIRNWLLCFEYVPNRSLDKYITDASCGLDWRKRYEIIKGICDGLLHLHEKRILHLDLKPGNILVDKHMVPKITDFGLSMYLDEEQSQAFTSNLCGSLGYLPPEFFRGQRGSKGQQGFASDIYGLGVIIMEILTGERWYPEDENVEQVTENWMNRLKDSDQWATQLEQVRVCTKIGIECMNLDPKKRPVARHIVNRLDKTTTAVETSILSSSVIWEQCCEEKSAMLSSEYPGKNIKEIAETEEHMGYGETSREDQWHPGQEEAPRDEWSSWEAQDTELNVSPQASAANSSSNFGVLYKLNNLDIFNRTRRKYMRNGGPMLEKIKHVKLFKKGELRLILKYKNSIGIDGFREVYQGLVDNVPVMVVRELRSSREEFANKVAILCNVSHRNIAKLIGCCVEIDIPILVYEFLSRGSLHDILHGNKAPLNLDLRLSIAAELSNGLAYMHSMASCKILHGDFNPSNILFDENFVPKISNFGMSRTATSEIIIGDISYMDPIFLQTGLLTEKSDVYSFGVVILELLTRKKVRYLDDSSLLRSFHENQKQGRKAAVLFDKEIALARDYELLDSLAQIVLECLDLDADVRPQMVDIAERLFILNRSR